MTGIHLSKICVGVVSDDEDQLRIIRNALHIAGVQIRLTSKPPSLKEEVFSSDIVDLWIVDLVCQESWYAFIDDFIAKATVPLIFGDGRAPSIDSNKFPRWQKRLRAKIEKMFPMCTDTLDTKKDHYAQRSDFHNCRDSNNYTISPTADFPKKDPEQFILEDDIKVNWNALPFNLININAEYAERVWVLGASLGGPSAVKEFLDGLDPSLPIAFVVVQHIDVGFQALLSQVLSRDNHFEVIQDFTRIRLRQGQVLIIPADCSITIDDDGYFMKTNIPWEDQYRPSINQVMNIVCHHFQEKSGAIIFSGMGNDSASAAEAFNASGGVIWAQSQESCVNSAQPDSIRETGKVSFNGTSNELAQKLTHILSL